MKKLIFTFLLITTFSIGNAADYYWVNGSGIFGDLTHWATTSGGAVTYNSAPTSTDNIFFDVASSPLPFTVDLNNAAYSVNDFNVSNNSNITNIFHGNLSIYGNLSLNKNLGVMANLGFNFLGTGAKTLKSGGSIFNHGNNPLVINSSSLQLTFLDNVVSNRGGLILDGGLLNTNNYNVNVSSFSSNTSNVRGLLLGSSTITTQMFILGSPTNFTLDAGTSLIKLVGTYVGTFGFSNGVASNFTFYNVEVQVSSCSLSYVNEFIFLGSTLTFNNITYNNNCANNTGVKFQGDNFIINNLQVISNQNVKVFTNLTANSIKLDVAGKNLQIQSGKVLTANNEIGLSSNNCSPTLINSSIPNSRAQIALLNGTQLIGDFRQVQDIETTGSGNFINGTASNDLGNNINVQFGNSLANGNNLLQPTLNVCALNSELNSNFVGSSTSVLWSTGATSPSITVTTNGNYSLTVNYNGGCEAIYPLAMPFDVEAPIFSNIPLNQTVCNGTPVYFATPNVTDACNYTITQTQGLPSGSVFPIGNTTVQYAAVDSRGYVSTTSFTITVNNELTVTASASANNVCSGNSVTLTASGASTYSWSNGIINGQAFTPLQTTTYSVTGNNGQGCTGNATITIQVNPIPTITISGATTICNGTSTTLVATGATSYLWNNGSIFNDITVSPSNNSTYTVTGTTNGCSSTAIKSITVNATPTVAASASAYTVSSNSPVTLSATGASSYTWSPIVNTVNGLSYVWSTQLAQTGTTVSIPHVYVTTTYTVTGTSNGCSSVATVTVNESATNPLIPNTKLSNAYCNSILATTGSTFYCDAISVPGGGISNYQYEFKVLSSAYPVSPNVVDMVYYWTRGSWANTMTLHMGGPLLEMNGRTYSVRVRACVNGVWGNFGPISCTLTTPEYTSPTTKLANNYCNINLSSADATFFCDPVTNCGPVANYRYEFTDVVTGLVNEVQRASGGTDMSLHNGGPLLEMNGKTYNVRVKALVYGEWSDYGPTCTLTTPSYIEPITKISDAYCGITLTTTTSTFYCDGIKYCGSVSDYQYEFTDLATNTITVRNRGSWATTMSLNIGGAGLAVLGKTYNVRVRGNVNGQWSLWGPSCTISTPAAARLANTSTGINSTTDKPIITLFPNPTIGLLSIESNTKIESVEVLNLTGALVEKFNGEITTIDLTRLETGLYFVKVISNGEAYQYKVMKN